MSERTFRDREILKAAQEQGTLATAGAFVRLSGPGWLQSAITLGGGSLVGALYLGMLGGTSMLWLQLVAITIGVIMLSAISYVTLSTRIRPYRAINDYVNPVLGVGWVTATILANMIWIIPQFALCFDSLDRSLLNQPLEPATRLELTSELGALEAAAGEAGSQEAAQQEARRAEIVAQLERAASGLGKSTTSKVVTSSVIGVLALAIVLMSFNPGWMSRIFDLILKLIVGMIVICFFAVVYYLATSGQLSGGEIFWGFIPKLWQWSSPAPEITALLQQLDPAQAEYWSKQIVAKQQEAMIGVTATAVGLNMTFLLPYSMLSRGWDSTFRGLARFDLITAMAIPYLLVTTCIVVASAHAFHAKADPAFLDPDPQVMEQSVLLDSTLGLIEARYLHEAGDEPQRAQREQDLNGPIGELERQMATADPDQQNGLRQQLLAARQAKRQTLVAYAAGLSEAEKRLIPTLVKPNASQLAATLKPLLGNNKRYADLIFGLGALGMGFSTIIILSLINGYAFAEISGFQQAVWPRVLGAVTAIAVGFCWFWIWQGDSKTWLSIVASTFGAILLPIAYISFFALMNSRRLLGDQKPTGTRMILWNVLMGLGVLGALLQAYGGIKTRIADPQTGSFVIGGVMVFVILAIIGFSATRREEVASD